MVIEFLHTAWYRILATENCMSACLNPHMNPIHYNHLIKQMHQKADTISALGISTICCKIPVNPPSWPSFRTVCFLQAIQTDHSIASTTMHDQVHSCHTLTALTWASVWNATWHITWTQFRWFQVRQTVSVVHVVSGVWSTFEWLSANPTWLTPLSR